MNMFFISQLFAACSLIATILCTWQKKRKKILMYLLLDSIFLTLSYSCLRAYTGAITNFICIFRNIVFYKKENNKIINQKYTPLFFALLHIMIGIIFFNSINSILPIIGSVIFCITAWQDNPRIVRFGTMLMVFMWLVYDITINSYVSIITETLAFLSAILAIVKMDIIKKDTDTKLLVEKFEI